MRTVKFTLRDRLVLTPIELRTALRYYPLFAIAVFMLFAAGSEGLVLSEGLKGLPLMTLGLVSILSGGLLTPVLLPLIPFRSFAVKGWITGVAAVAIALGFLETGWLLKAASLILFPALSSYMALQFTGATVFTGISGVRKELRIALPVYISAVAISAVLLIAFKFSEWGLI